MKKSEWAFKRKMSFKSEPTKPIQEVIFSRKLKTVPHPSITFNNQPINLYTAQKHLVLVLDSKLTFNEHMKHISSKVNKSIGLLRKFHPVLPRSSFFTICKTFIRLIISTMLMFFMAKAPSRRFTKNLSQFNTMLLWQ